MCISGLHPPRPTPQNQNLYGCSAQVYVRNVYLLQLVFNLLMISVQFGDE